MMLKLKNENVRMHGLSFHICLALVKAMKVWKLNGMMELLVTSARDGKHMDGSKHYTGEAVDLRSRNLPDAVSMRNQLQHELGPDFDVILERDHIHIEYDPD